jgi:hypothetical protein
VCEFMKWIIVSVLCFVGIALPAQQAQSPISRVNGVGAYPLSFTDASAWFGSQAGPGEKTVIALFFFEGPSGWLTEGTNFKYEINGNPAIINMTVGSIPILERYWFDTDEIEVQGERYKRSENNVFLIRFSGDAKPIVKPLGLHDLHFSADDLPPVVLLGRDRTVWATLSGGEANDAGSAGKPEVAPEILGWDAEGLKLLASDATPDQQKGCELFRQAANRGYAPSQYRLGYCYESGKGAPQSFQTANQWYEKAATQGYVDAEYKLGHSYRTGRGTSIDLPVALGWYMKAADAGDQDALHNVGWMYSTGQGVKKDENEAYKWFLRAAKEGEASSQLEVASRLQDGTGITKDMVLSYSWLLVLEAQKESFQADDWKQIQSRIVEIGGALNPSDRQRAKDQSRIWMGEIAHNDMVRYGRR